MNQGFTQPPNGLIKTLGRKSWTAYVGLFVLAFIIGILAVPMAWIASTGFGILVMTALVAFVVFRFIELRVYHLYCNDMGVWLCRGILPWSKGVIGVKWRDMDDATYSQGMMSWLLKSYSMRVGHRFMRSSELLLAGVDHGDKALMAINTMHQKMAREGKLN